jgi:hypothetical protein
MDPVEGENDCPCGSGKQFKNCHGSPKLKNSSRQWRIQKIQDGSPEVKARARQFRNDAVADSFSGPQPIKLDFQDYTFRAIGSRLYYKEKYRTYVDFLLDLIKFAFGPKWHKAQVALPEAQRHTVMQWMGSWYRHCSKVRPKDAPPTAICATAPTGDGQALLTLADDLYRLQLARSLTSRLMHRLRTPEEFQGVRYEIQVASIFLRSGFEVQWSDEKNKHCEFFAVHRHTKQQLAVEAKSRRRPGVLGVQGTFSTDHPIGIEALYEDARKQNPGDRPFCIFIDVNWPAHPELPRLGKPWMKEVFQWAQKHVPTRENPETVALSAFTNYSWHYQGPELAQSHEILFSLPAYAVRPLSDAITRDALLNSVRTYGVKIEEAPTPMIQKQVIEQLAAL